jgi:outer membrane beta-barrel protein
MESRIRVLLLMLACAALAGCAHIPFFKRYSKAAAETAQNDPAAAERAEQAEQSAEPPTVIEPRVERREIKVPKIDSENWGLGAYYGEISIEDFTAVPLSGFRVNYHVTEDFFFEGAYDRARAGRTSFETLGGNVQLLSDAEREFTHYSLSVGYNFLPGEVFLGRNLTLTSGFYLLGGIGSTKFAGDQHFTINFGAGFRVLPTDWLAIHIGAQDLVFKSDLLGVNRLKNNLQAHIGVTAFF